MPKPHDDHWWSQWMPYSRTKKYRHCMIFGCTEVEYSDVT